MRYLILAADYMRPNLRDEDPDNDLDPWHALSAALREEIAEWNDRYQVIIPMDMPARSAAAGVISALDLGGLELVARIEEELGPSKVRYYSEGLMRYLP